MQFISVYKFFGNSVICPDAFVFFNRRINDIIRAFTVRLLFIAIRRYYIFSYSGNISFLSKTSVTYFVCRMQNTYKQRKVFKIENPRRNWRGLCYLLVTCFLPY